MTLLDHYLAMMSAFFDHLGGDAASTLEHYLTLAQPVLDHYGYLAVFGAVLVEGFGIPAPGQTMLMAGAILAARGGMSIEWVLAFAFLAAPPAPQQVAQGIRGRPNSPVMSRQIGLKRGFS